MFYSLSVNEIKRKEEIRLNREILFRGKRKDNGEWIEGFYFSMEHDDGRHIHHFIIPFGADLSLGTSIEKIQVEVDPETVCQYTGWGWNDNDMKIFEGDIVKVDGCWTGVVVWEFNDTSFEVEPYNELESMESLGMVANGNEVEVIGNIFDNSDLLKSLIE